MSITQDILKAHNLKPHHADSLVRIAKKAAINTAGFIVGEHGGDPTIRMFVRRGLLEYCKGVYVDGWWFERARATAAGVAAGEAIRLDIIEQGPAGPDFPIFHWNKIRQTTEQAFDLFKRGRL